MNKYLSRGMAVLLCSLCLFTLPVYGADGQTVLRIEGRDGSYSLSPGSMYTDSDLFSSFKNLMPGDVKTEQITIENHSAGRETLRLFIQSVPHTSASNPLSPSVAAKETIASMTDFLSRLTLKIWAGEKLIFVGTADRGLDGVIPLGAIPWNDRVELRAEISVPLELGNEYANRMGEVDWKLTMEEESAPVSGGSALTVRKLWSDGNDRHRENPVTVYLQRDGVPWQSAVLDESNGWCCAFGGLSTAHTWTVTEETAYPGYVVSYHPDGGVVAIVNEAENGDPIPNLGSQTCSVRKVWAESDKEHPDYVECTLYRDLTPMETVRLSEDNQWTHIWTELDGGFNWQVVETSCEGSFVPSYRNLGNGAIEIENTAILIQTGWQTWPLWLLAGGGMILLLLGIALRKHHET